MSLTIGHKPLLVSLTARTVCCKDANKPQKGHRLRTPMRSGSHMSTGQPARTADKPTKGLSPPWAKARSSKEALAHMQVQDRGHTNTI